MRRSFVIAAVTVASGFASAAWAQDTGGSVPDFDKKRGGSAKMQRLANVPAHPGAWKAADVELEQDRNRPYAYLSGFVNYDVTIYDISNASSPKQIYRWSIENPELHRGIGAMDGKYFKINGRYYFAQSLQFQQGTPDADVGAVILDVTGLPDASKVKEVARIKYPAAPGGFHNTFAYKHSDGRALYFVTTNQSKAIIYDLSKIVSGADQTTWIVGEVPNPTPMRQTGLGGYHDFTSGTIQLPRRTSSMARGWVAIRCSTSRSPKRRRSCSP